MNGLPTISLYDQESQNNNTKVIEMLDEVAPGADATRYIPQLLKVVDAMGIIQTTTRKGQVLIHINGNDINIELRGTYPKDGVVDID